MSVPIQKLHFKKCLTEIRFTMDNGTCKYHSSLVMEHLVFSSVFFS